MKKVISIITLVITIFSIQSFITSSEIAKDIPIAKKKEPIKHTEDVKYIYCYGWEQPKPGTNGKKQPVLTTIFKFTCDKNDESKILNDFNSYYEAYHKRTRNTMYMKDANKMIHDNYADAEKSRREYIAKYVNSYDNPLFIKDFSVTCEF